MRRQQTAPLPAVPGEEIYDINDRIQNVSIANDANRRQTVHSSNNMLNQSVISGYQPLQLHPVVGRNIVLSQERTVATRVDNEFCQGYVFSQRPIKYGEQFVIQILKTDSLYGGSLAIGLTSCCPNTLSSAELPDDSDLLLDRPEYWVVSKDVGQIVQLSRGDEIKFSVAMTGEVQISRNDNAPVTLMFIDQSLQLWPFFDVYGSTQAIRVLSKSIPQPPAYQQPPPLSIHKALTSPVPLNHRMMPAQPQVSTMCEAGVSSASMSRSGTTTSIISGTSNGDIQVQSSGTVLVVNLPPQATVKSMSASQPSIMQRARVGFKIFFRVWSAFDRIRWHFATHVVTFRLIKNLFPSILERNSSIGMFDFVVRICSLQEAAERAVCRRQRGNLRVHLELRSQRASRWSWLHDLLRKPNRLGALYVRTHVHVLRLCDEALAWRHQRRRLSTVPCAHPGRNSHIQVVNNRATGGSWGGTQQTIDF